MAMAFAYIEYIIEIFFFAELKRDFSNKIMWITVPLALLGVGIRLLAFWTASSNFHHLIRYQVENGHMLITGGIYSLERHPGYLGYFIFAVLSQITIMNPFSFLLFLGVLWYFFYERICEEEVTLCHIFGDSYFEYRHKVNTHILFINSLVETHLNSNGFLEGSRFYGAKPK